MVQQRSKHKQLRVEHAYISAPSAALLPTPSLLLPFSAFIAVLSVYISTAYPSVSGGDSGELIMTTCKLGIAHPPGYPLFTMMGWMWSEVVLELPILRTITHTWHRAYRINIMSAALGSIAAAAIAWTTAKTASGMSVQPSHSTSPSPPLHPLSSIPPYLIGCLSALGFAWMPSVWLYSIQGEVFALNNCLLALLIMLTLIYYDREEKVEVGKEMVGWNKKREDETDVKGNDNSAGLTSSPTSDVAAKQFDDRSQLAVAPTSRSLIPLAYLGAVLCGLCLTNQHTTVFPVLVTSAFISFSLWQHHHLSLRRILLLLTFVLFGLSPYVYILIRSHWRVVDSWGDQRTLAGFVKHLLRQEYGTFQLAASELSTDPGMMSRLGVYLSNMLKEMDGPIIPLMAVIGLFSSLRSPSRAVRRTSIVLLFSYLFYVIVFHKLANLDLRPLFLGVQARFWQQANLYVWVWSAMGIHTCIQWIAHVMERMDGMKHARTSIQQHKPSNSTSPSSSSSSPHVSFFLTSLCVLPFISFHLLTHLPAHSHGSNWSFWTAGVSQLQSFPPNAIVLLNGDLNHNMIKYPQTCEGMRPDLSLLSLQLMSWDWFVPVQRPNYPNVTFPGIRYHVSTPHSFNIKRFLDANYPFSVEAQGKMQKKSKQKNVTNRKSNGGIFLCGPWKDGDHSNQRTKDTKHYEEHPFGLCSQLLPHGDAPKNLSSFLRSGWNGLARPSALPPFNEVSMGEETWENVLYRDNWARLLYLFSYAAFHSNKNMKDKALLKLAYELAEQVIDERNEALLQQHKMIGEYEYRSTGVIFGMWSQHLLQQGSESESARVSRLLYYAWSQYDLFHPNDPEIIPSLNGKKNPYTGMKIEGIEQDRRIRLVQKMREERAQKQGTQRQKLSKNGKSKA